MKTLRLLSVVSMLLAAAPALAGVPPWQAGRRQLASNVQDFLSRTSRGGPSTVGERLSKVIGNDPDALEAVALMAKHTSKNGAGGAQLSRQVRDALSQLHRDLGDDAKFRQFLKEYKALSDWAANQPPAVRDQLAEVTRDFTRFTRKGRLLRGYSRGAAYELKLAAKYQRAGVLKSLQPRLTGDHKLYRDALLDLTPGPPPLQVFVEAKNWKNLSVAAGEARLLSQTRSHFERMFAAGLTPAQILSVPPMAKLRFEFNDRLPRKWRSAIKKSVIQTLQDAGLTKTQAKNWADQHLEIVTTGF